MDEVELLDEALIGCSNLKQGIAALLEALCDVTDEKSTEKNKDNPHTAPTDMLGKPKDVILKANVKTVTNPKTKKNRSSKNKKSKGKKTKLSDNKTVDKLPIQSNENKDSDEAFDLKNSLGLKSESTSNIFETDSIAFGINSGLRSLTEINSTYAKIEKRYIEVKRSIESAVVEMKYIDEIVNRQKDVFHINFSCANNETFICHH